MSAPSEARDVFGATLPVAVRYASILADQGVVRGLIGPREVDRLWQRHLINCAVVAELVPERSAVLDLGSGAGLPGLVLSIVRDDLSMTLLEPLLRRSTFLTECVGELGIRNVEVRRARAEEVIGDYAVDVVTARAVAPLDRLVRWALPLLRPGGQLLALKGERAGVELEEAAAALRGLGVRSAELLRVGQGRVDPPTTVIRVIADDTEHTSGATPGRSQRVRPAGRARAKGSKKGLR